MSHPCGLSSLRNPSTCTTSADEPNFRADPHADPYRLLGRDAGRSKIVPDEFQRVVGGASISSGSALVGAAAAVGGGVAGVAAGMAGVPGMAVSAFQLAQAQMGAADSKAAEANGGQAPKRSRIARAAALTGGTAKNLAMAPARDIGRRLTGDIGARHGVATWRMAADMANQRRLLSDDNNKPPPPPPPGGGGNNIS